jgi:trichohyalin
MKYFDYEAVADRVLDGSRSWEIDVEQLLRQSRASHRGRIERELERIRKQLDNRDDVHRTHVEELEESIEWYVDQLRSTYRRFRTVDEERKDRLKEVIRTFYHELRRERREHWQDRQQLEHERRDLLHELDELEDDALHHVYQ